MLSFDLHENIWKSSVFYIFKGGQKGALGKNGLIKSDIISVMWRRPTLLISLFNSFKFIQITAHKVIST